MKEISSSEINHGVGVESTELLHVRVRRKETALWLTSVSNHGGENIVTKVRKTQNTFRGQ